MLVPRPAPADLRRAGKAAALTGVLLGAVLTACTAAPPSGGTAGSPGGPVTTTTSPTANGGSGDAARTGQAGTATASSSAPVPSAGPARDVVTGLAVPWSVAVLPADGVLVSERDTARVVQVRADGTRADLGRVPDVVPGGEGGLLGLVLDPENPSVVYAYTTTARDNRVVALALTESGLGAPRPVLTGIPKAAVHNGGRLAFGPDGYLYVGTGDAGDRTASQDRGSLGGKILRITREGAPAPGNPDAGSPMWTLGHRNVQGFAWDSAGRMWASEFGQNTWDELNEIVRGTNYGWPVVEGRAGRPGLTDPVLQWAPTESSPSGLTVGTDGAVYLAALRGQSLWRVPVRPDGSAGEPQRLLQGQYGRLRDVLTGPDGRLWVVSNNTARGSPRPGDDRIVSLDPADRNAG